MDQQRERIQEDLRGLVSGEVRCDDVATQLYASDASIYQIRPLGVVRPRTERDLIATVQYVGQYAGQYPRDTPLSLHVRGAGTGLCGEALGTGLVVDCSRYMRRIIRVSDSHVRVQPGVVLERLNAYLAQSGRMFAPDPAMSGVTTLGSVLATDASGSHFLKHGSARSHVESLQVVLADGELIDAGLEPLENGVSVAENPRKRQLIDDLARILAAHAPAIAEEQPRSRLNSAGYQLAGVLTPDSLDLRRLLVGSEGTLAIITEATLSTVPLPACRGTLLLFFDRLETAARAVMEILPFGPAACDLMDRRHLSLAREHDVRFDLIIPAAAEAMLLVEFEEATPAAVRDLSRRTLDRVRQETGLAFDARLGGETEEIELHWELVRKVVPTLHRLKGSTRALPFVEDFAVPPETLPAFFGRMVGVLQQHQVTASLYGHVGHGQIHLRPFLDLADPDDIRKIAPLTRDLYDIVIEMGGTISGEHGDGLSRTSFLRQQYPRLHDVFRQIKQAFDPLGILNPGKVVGDDGELLTRNLRPAALPVVASSTVAQSTASGDDATRDTAPASTAPTQAPLVDLQLHWTRDEIVDTARNCNGCGACRSQAPGVRMCPIFRIAPAEEASPRAKANLMRAIVMGQLDPGELARDELKGIANLCVHCHMCRLECPAQVDIPKLMLEAKGAYTAANGLRFREWVLTRLDWLSAWGKLIRPVANWSLGNRQMRWLLEKLLGIAQGRKLPRLAPRTFMRKAARRRLTKPTRRSGQKVLFFVDTYANFYDPQLAEAVVAVLEHNGVAVYVHPDQASSGMPLVALGAVDRARKTAAHNVAILAEAVRQGYHIVASEPSAALAITREYPQLLDDEDARLVAANTSEACAYLWNMHLAGKLLLNLKPVNATVGYHLPCHVLALEAGAPGENLLRLIPGLTVQRIEKGCSGMAGIFGLRRENFRASIRAGIGLISAVRDSTWHAGTTECSTCKMQMEQGTTKPTVHPLKLFALSYGKLPELERLLTAHSEELTVT